MTHSGKPPRFPTWMRIVAVGGGIGLVLAYWMSRVLRSLLFGTDGASLVLAATAVATLAASTLLACYLPARRLSGHGAPCPYLQWAPASGRPSPSVP